LVEIDDTPIKNLKEKQSMRKEDNIRLFNKPVLKIFKRYMGNKTINLFSQWRLTKETCVEEKENIKNLFKDKIQSSCLRNNLKKKKSRSALKFSTKNIKTKFKYI